MEYSGNHESGFCRTELGEILSMMLCRKYPGAISHRQYVCHLLTGTSGCSGSAVQNRKNESSPKLAKDRATFESPFAASLTAASSESALAVESYAKSAENSEWRPLQRISLTCCAKISIAALACVLFRDDFTSMMPATASGVRNTKSPSLNSIGESVLKISMSICLEA